MHTSRPPGWSVTGWRGLHDSDGSDGSVIVTPSIATAPSLVATRVNVMTSPAAPKLLGFAVLVSDTCGVPAASTVAVAASDSTAPAGELPVARAVLTSCPAASSSAVTAWLPVQVTLPPTGSVPSVASVQSQTRSPRSGSSTATPVRVTLPSLVTTRR